MLTQADARPVRPNLPKSHVKSKAQLYLEDLWFLIFFKIIRIIHNVLA